MKFSFETTCIQYRLHEYLQTFIPLQSLLPTPVQKVDENFWLLHPKVKNLFKLTDCDSMEAIADMETPEEIDDLELYIRKIGPNLTGTERDILGHFKLKPETFSFSPPFRVSYLRLILDQNGLYFFA